MLRSHNHRTPLPSPRLAARLRGLFAPLILLGGPLSTLLLAGRPRTVFERRAETAVPGPATDTGQTFIVGFAQKGPANEAVRIRTLEEFEDTFGDGLTGVNTTLYDSVEEIIGEGHGTVYAARVVGPTPVKATLTLNAASSTAALRIDALYHGAYGNDISVAVTNVAAGEFDLEVRYLDELVEAYRDNLTTAGLQALLAASEWVRGTLLSSGDLVALADTNLATGTDDNGSATDNSWADALEAFGPELGPGQVLAPGRTTTVAHGQLFDHAEANNRVALIGAANGASKATLIALAAATAALDNSTYGAGFPIHITLAQRVPGVARTVPGEVFAAGLIARSDIRKDPNTWPIRSKSQRTPESGNGIAGYAKTVAATFSNADQDDLYNAGWNITFADRATAIPILNGFRSITDEDAWHDFAHARLFMAVQAQADGIGEGFVGEQITAAVITRWHQALDGLLFGYYTDGALFGGFVEPTADQAYRVVTADPVNTAETAAARGLNAEIYLRASEHAEIVRVIGTKVPVTSPVAA